MKPKMAAVLTAGLALVCFGMGLIGCASSGERLVREYAECMADSNSKLHRRMVSGQTGVVPGSGRLSGCSGSTPFPNAET